MKKTTTIATLFTGLIVFTLHSCQEDQQKGISINEEEIAQEAIEDFENYRLKLNLVDSHYLEFPSPVELASNYKNSGIEYIPGITNPMDNFERYHTHTKKSLNFGVYSADLSYCVLNDQGQCASDYISALQTLSERIGLSEIFRYEVVAAQFNQSLGDKDSMTKLVRGIQQDLDKTLRQNGTQDRAILFYTGAWVESAYIAFSAKSNFSNSLDSASLSQITMQLEMLTQLNEELSRIGAVNSEVEELQNRMMEFEELAGQMQITSTGDSVVINAMDLKKLQDKIFELRSFIVS
ncbi:hypothetical protein KFE98_21345 [bacterium SCSIO 12741]|nr:hypothetical protein KFE98_21345 [bacterium SCSIO 12741]